MQDRVTNCGACQTGSGIHPSEAERADHMSNIDLQIVRHNWEGIRRGSLHRRIRWSGQHLVGSGFVCSLALL